jgi:hypothetical protein
MEGLGGDSDSTGFEMPSLMTGLSQPYANYSAGGSPSQYGPSGAGLQDDSGLGTAEENDAKRRRIARVRRPTLREYVVVCD